MKKILICHPDEATRESIKLILSDHYDMILTADFSASLDVLKHAKDIFLFLLKIDSSKEFSPKNVKETLGDYPELKIMVLSERKFNVKAEEAVKQGATGVLSIPFKMEEILAIAKKSSKYKTLQT